MTKVRPLLDCLANLHTKPVDNSVELAAWETERVAWHQAHPRPVDGCAAYYKSLDDEQARLSKLATEIMKKLRRGDLTIQGANDAVGQEMDSLKARIAAAGSAEQQ